MELVKNLRETFGMAIIWIIYDLGIIVGLAYRVMVMYAGFIVERASVEELYANPLHPYTRGLLGSLLCVDVQSDEDLVNIEGMSSDLLHKPVGCPFAPRCKWAFKHCQEENPTLANLNGHEVACWWDIDGGKPRHA